MQLSQNEIRIIEKIRSLRPYQKMEIMADGSGKADCYVITNLYREKLEEDGRIQFLQVSFKIKEQE